METKKKVVKKAATKKVAKKKVAKKVAKKVTKKPVAKKTADPIDGLLSTIKKSAEKKAIAVAKENAPADKLMKRLEAFCKKNKIKIYGTFDLYGLEKMTTRAVNVESGLEFEGLKRITENELQRG